MAAPLFFARRGRRPRPLAPQARSRYICLAGLPRTVVGRSTAPSPWTGAIPEHLAPRLAALRQLVAGQVAALETTAFGQGFCQRRTAPPGAPRPRPRPRPLRTAPAARLGRQRPDLARAGPGRRGALGWSPLGHYIFNCQAPDVGNMELLLRHGSPEQHERWLAPLARGEMRSCFGMTEPGRSGANPVWLQTTAHRDGADYVLDGHKWFASSADGAAFCIVMAVTDATAAVHGRASMLLVPTGTPGFQLVRNLPVMGEAGTGWMSHGELRLDGVRVPASHRIGAEGAGFALAQERLGPGRIHHCMRWIGICERAFDLMCRRAATRELAPGDMLGSRQLVQAWVAESRAEIDAARLLVLHAAWRIQRDGAAAARRRDLAGQVPRRRRPAGGARPRHPDSRPPPACWTIRRWRSGGATSAAPASTTARTRCTKPPWRGASWPPMRRRRSLPPPMPPPSPRPTGPDRCETAKSCPPPVWRPGWTPRAWDPRPPPAAPRRQLPSTPPPWRSSSSPAGTPT